MSIYRAIHCRNCPHTVVWYASPDYDRKFFLGRWTNTISGLCLVLFPPNINPIIVSNDNLTFVWKYISVPLTFNSSMKLFSGPFHTLFPVNLSDPDFLLYNSPVVSFLIQGTLNCSFRHLSLSIFIKSASFNGVLRSLRTSLTSPRVSLSSSKRWVLYEACFPLILCA